MYTKVVMKAKAPIQEIGELKLYIREVVVYPPSIIWTPLKDFYNIFDTCAP